MQKKHIPSTRERRANKTFGQHFLKSRAVLDVIIHTANIQLDDVVLEIGPGKGVLTQELLKKAKQVVAVEKDRLLIPQLQNTFAWEVKTKKLILIEGDILKFTPEHLGLVKNKYKIVANIPYYITGHFLRQFLSTNTQPTTMTLLVQKEVAERIVAQNGKESVLSLSVKAYGTPSIIRKVPAGCFSPPPKVDSAILHIANISKKSFNNLQEEHLFFELIKKAFGQKRKQVLSILPREFKKDIQKYFLDKKINELVRAENIPMETWLGIAKLSI